jgi:non-heme chloroperoxidase
MAGRSSLPWSGYDYNTLADDLAQFKVPTLIIHGTDDKTVPIDAAGRAAAKGIAGSTLPEYDCAPHGLFDTHKNKLMKGLLDFIRS